MRPRDLWFLAFALASTACLPSPGGPPRVPSPMHELAPVQSQLSPHEPYYSPQPHRDHPRAVVASADGSRAWVTLPGSEADPGREIAVVDTERMEVIARVEVGSRPEDMALHPSGRFLVVTHGFSPFLSVVDTVRHVELGRIEAPWYTAGIAFSPEGTKAWVANRWLDSVLVYDVRVDGALLRMERRTPPQARLVDRGRGWPSIPVGTNPRDVFVDADRGRVYVANLPELTISVLDMATDAEIDTDRDPDTTDPRAPAGVTRLKVVAPVNDLLVHGETLFVATLGRGTGHPATEGPDTDLDGHPGDGTPNVNFQDVQNDIATWNAATFEAGPRYTSDSLTGFYKDLPEGTPGLPAAELRIVRGALPEQLALLDGPEGPRLSVLLSGSGEVALYAIDGDELELVDAFEVGLFPQGLAAAGDRLLVANRLSETLSRVDPSSRAVEHMVVGDISRGAFPATDAEIGELYNAMSAPFSADGDQTCEHCHRDAAAIAKVHSMPLQQSVLGSRLVPPHRNLLRTRPLFFEDSLDETNFIPVMNEFAREENFGPGRPRDDHASRNDFFVATSERLMRRRMSFGDSRQPVLLDFNGIARMLGVFLLSEPRLLPNPNDPNTYAAQRGRAIFEGTETGCAVCHPAPHFTLSTDLNPTGLATAMKVVTPNRYAGKDTDILAPGFIRLFGGHNDRFAIPSLRGLWDRPEIFYHDGRATSLVEALATPDHPALRPGEVGHNELDGVPDRHGGTSHLDAHELRDLAEFLRTIE